MVVVCSMNVGLMMPPIGVGFYIACRIGNVSPDEAMGAIWPFADCRLPRKHRWKAAVRAAWFRRIYSVTSRSLRFGRNAPILLKESDRRPEILASIQLLGPAMSGRYYA